ncbi:hypothetical protein LIA77_00004 [Sarocladium implicatum]|nr:hypothetical protein LIA77_00004 [Sarocladium implicatum]
MHRLSPQTTGGAVMPVTERRHVLKKAYAEERYMPKNAYATRRHVPREGVTHSIFPVVTPTSDVAMGARIPVGSFQPINAGGTAPKDRRPGTEGSFRHDILVTNHDILSDVPHESTSLIE